MANHLRYIQRHVVRSHAKKLIGVSVSIQDLLDKFNGLLQVNTWWKRFTNSQFMQMMAVFGAQIIYAAQSSADRGLAEGFISTATKRSSILAAAEDRNYIGHFITPSWGSVRITNKTDEPIQLPIFSEFLSLPQIPYVTTDVIMLPAHGSVEVANFKQMERVSVSTVIDAAAPFFTVMLPRDVTAETVSMDVYVTEGDDKTQWVNNPLFRLSRGDSKHYVLVYKPTEQLGVRFGDGAIGAMPSTGSIVDLDVWCSQGDTTLTQGQKLTPAGNIADLNNKIEVITTTPITGGSGFESTEETRNRAQYYVAYDEQVVWGGDYKYFLNRTVPGMSWISAWGEQEQEQSTGIKSLANINTIFFCGHKPGYSQAELETMIMSAVTAIPNELNKTFRYVATNEEPFTVSLTAIAKKSVIISDAKDAVQKALESQFGRDATTFGDSYQSDVQAGKQFAQVQVKDLWRVIEELDLFISYEVVTHNLKNALQLNDFIYLDVTNSAIDIKYL